MKNISKTLSMLAFLFEVETAHDIQVSDKGSRPAFYTNRGMDLM